MRPCLYPPLLSSSVPVLAACPLCQFYDRSSVCALPWWAQGLITTVLSSALIVAEPIGPNLTSRRSTRPIRFCGNGAAYSRASVSDAHGSSPPSLPVDCAACRYNGAYWLTRSSKMSPDASSDARVPPDPTFDPTPVRTGAPTEPGRVPSQPHTPPSHVETERAVASSPLSQLLATGLLPMPKPPASEAVTTTAFGTVSQWAALSVPEVDEASDDYLEYTGGDGLGTYHACVKPGHGHPYEHTSQPHKGKYTAALGLVIDGDLFQSELYGSVLRAQTYATWLIRCTNAVYANTFGLEFQVGTLMIFDDSTAWNQTSSNGVSVGEARPTQPGASAPIPEFKKTFNARCSTKLVSRACVKGHAQSLRSMQTRAYTNTR